MPAGEYGGRRHKSWLASCMPSLGCPGDSRYALASIGASQVANWFVGVIKLGGPSGDLQLVTLVALIALARTFGVYLRILCLVSERLTLELSSLVPCGEIFLRYTCVPASYIQTPLYRPGLELRFTTPMDLARQFAGFVVDGGCGRRKRTALCLVSIRDRQTARAKTCSRRLID